MFFGIVNNSKNHKTIKLFYGIFASASCSRENFCSFCHKCMYKSFKTISQNAMKKLWWMYLVEMHVNFNIRFDLILIIFYVRNFAVVNFARLMHFCEWRCYIFWHLLKMRLCWCYFWIVFGRFECLDVISENLGWLDVRSHFLRRGFVCEEVRRLRFVLLLFISFRINRDLDLL